MKLLLCALLAVGFFAPSVIEATQSDQEVAYVFYHGHHDRHRGWGRVYYNDHPYFYDRDFYGNGPHYYYDDPYYYQHNGAQLRIRIR